MAKNIIKNGAAQISQIDRSNLVKSRIVEARNRAKEIDFAAKENAAETVERARREAEALLDEAYRAGSEKAASEFTQTLADAYAKRDALLREVEPDVLKLAVRIAEKIIGREIQTDKQTVAEIVATALRNMRQQERIIVRVNPVDFQQIQEFKNLLNLAGRAAFLDFEPDPKVITSGCIIESEVGTVDARLETQFKILERSLLRQAETE